MSTPDESSFLRDAESMYGPETLHELEHEVRLDLDMIAASEPERVVPVSEWLVDPTEVERDEVALRSLLGAVEAMEGELPRPDDV
ncbi:hypothetical protein BWI15_25835 [Kribbella sp. ALI-6-A]|uniref:hypothetical protein n=1 Tax=Kribbella sp. ALI-6-A TaxID=1933817 RepID=UPI00097C3E2B|nr:hypothetical protein [Kribbella sp. ALI-6-A]ONI69932.1 hypothetical protein BWI15_25835 [Kribbella sp. ALI-6-A]